MKPLCSSKKAIIKQEERLQRPVSLILIKSTSCIFVKRYIIIYYMRKQRNKYGTYLAFLPYTYFGITCLLYKKRLTKKGWQKLVEKKKNTSSHNLYLALICRMFPQWLYVENFITFSLRHSPVVALRLYKTGWHSSILYGCYNDHCGLIFFEAAKCLF